MTTRLLTLALAALLLGCSSHAGPRSVVSRVIDGDTMEMADGERVRLACIDTPERGQPGSEAATARLEELVSDDVWLNRLDTDRWGRTIAEVHSVHGDVGRLLVVEGYAEVHPRYRAQCKWSRH